MFKYMIVFVSTVVCLSASQAATEQLPDLSTIDSPFIKDGKLDLEATIKHFEDLYRSDSSIAQMTLTVTKPRRTRTLTMKTWTRGQDRALVIIQSPAKEKGMATLKVDKNLWNFLPRIKRTIRIPPSMMQASWMGSDFTNDDVVREASLSDDYTYRLVGPSPKPSGWLIRFEAKPKMVGLWKRIELILCPDGTLPLAAKYYDRKDRLARTLTWQDVKIIDGKNIPTRMTLIPEDKKANKTEMVYTSIRFNANVPDRTFSLSELERAR